MKGNKEKEGKTFFFVFGLALIIKSQRACTVLW